jgi:AraC family transcriptional regulator
MRRDGNASWKAVLSTVSGRPGMKGNYVDLGSSQPHNLGSSAIQSYRWSGLDVHLIQQQVLSGPAWHRLSSDRPILSVVVDEVGGNCEARLAVDDVADNLRSRRRRNGHISLIPGGTAVWGYSDQIARVDEVRLILDVDSLLSAMGGVFPTASLGEPRLMFLDSKLQALARLLATSEPDMRGFVLFNDSVVAAIIARLAELSTTGCLDDRRLGLTARQLAQVTEFMLDNIGQPVRLAELATLAGLSASQFGRAFKVSTGTTPHKWHLDARICHAKRLLLDDRHSIVAIALDAGFSEQSHFTRAFRAATGASPSAWRQSRIN